MPATNSTGSKIDSLPIVVDQDKEQPVGLEMLDSENLANNSGAEIKTLGSSEGTDNVEVASGSPLPGVKPQQLDELITIPKETIDVLRDQVFGFDTFFVTGQEPYEVKLFKHLHLLLLQVRDSTYKLSGARLRPGESDIDGLRRKLSNKLSEHYDGTGSD